MAAIHARMRISNSPLRADLCNTLHVIQNPLCECGSGQIEDAVHFFFKCTRYTTERAQMVADLLPHVIGEEQANWMLFGIPDQDHLTNIHVFAAVHKFMKNSGRFT